MNDVVETQQVMVPSAAQALSAAPANPDLRWYVVHAYSGMEKAVERNLDGGTVGAFLSGSHGGSCRDQERSEKDD